MTRGFTNRELTLPEQPCCFLERSFCKGRIANYITIPQLFFDISTCKGIPLLVSGPPKAEESLQWTESAVIPSMVEGFSNIFVVLPPKEFVTLFGPGGWESSGIRAQLRQFRADLK